MAQRRRKLSTADVFVVLCCFCQVALRAVSGVEFTDVDISENWSTARKACKQKNKILVQIDNINLFNSTKKRLWPSSGNTHWTGLKYQMGELMWSNGRKASCNGTLVGVLNCAGLKNLTTRCFLLKKDSDVLSPEDCKIAHRYICQTAPTITTVKPTSRSRQTSHSTAHSTAAGNSNRGGLIENYLQTIRLLNETDPSSLQGAMNATDKLLIDLKTSAENMNVLLASQALEAFVKSYAKQQLTTMNDSLIEKRDELVIILRKVHSNSEDVIFNATSGRCVSGTPPFNLSNVQIRLPASMFPEHGGYVSVILYNNIDQLLPLQAQDLLDGTKTARGHMGSHIIAITVEPMKNLLQDRVLIDFSHLKVMQRMSKPDCVFWNFSVKTSFNGSWSKKGCRTVNYTSNRTYCSCDHLTHFAVLMQLKDEEDGSNTFDEFFETEKADKITIKHRVVLEIITYIGCALSLMGEFITIVAYVVFLNLKTGDTQIRLSFVISIAVAQIIFLLGIDATKSQAVCTTVAAAMHYFFLVSFCWMLIEGLTLYYKVVKVFDTDFKMRLFYGFAWGFPMVIVLISLLTTATSESGIASYIGENFCWLSFSNGLVWFFVAPVLIISLINIFVLAQVTRELYTMHPTNVSSESNKFKRVLRACLVLCPLLGVTWVFGLLSVTEPIGLVFQYLFTICNSLQGFLIFLRHVVRSSEFRATVKRKFQRWGSKRSANIVPALVLPTNGNSYELRRKDSFVLGRKEGSSFQPATSQHRTHSTLT